MLYQSQISGYGQIVVDWRLTIIIHDPSTSSNYTLPLIGVPGGLWLNHTLDVYGPSGYAPLSVRDSSGTVWIQSKVVSLCQQLCPYTFHDLFNIANMRFDRQCVPNGRGGEYCQTATAPAPFMVDSSKPDTACYTDPSLGLSNGKTWIIYLGIPDNLQRC